MTAVALPTPGLKPKSLSASALNTAGLCLDRYNAEYIQRSRGFGGQAASLGTAVHGALEMFVKMVYIDGKAEMNNLKALLDFYQMSYMQTFGTSDTSGEVYNDGVEMLKTWFKRTSFDGVQVLSVEQKLSFDVTDKKYDYTLPFNYIFDRLDLLDPVNKVYKVVDYKTVRWPLRPADLNKKLQARIYALVCQMQYPDASRIWVEFDLLRHERVGIVFTKEQNAQTWHLIKSELRRILDTPEDEVFPTLNPECKFCVKKVTCDAYLKNAATGGVFSFGDTEQMVERRATLEWQKAAIEAAIKELDTQIVTEFRENDVTEFDTDIAHLDFKVSKRRNISPEMVQLVVGEEKFGEYGGLNLSMAQFDALLKDPEVDDDKKRQLKNLVSYNFGEERVNITQRNIGLE